MTHVDGILKTQDSGSGGSVRGGMDMRGVAGEGEGKTDNDASEPATSLEGRKLTILSLEIAAETRTRPGPGTSCCVLLFQRFGFGLVLNF